MSICDLFNDKKIEETLKERLLSLGDTSDILEMVYNNLDPKTVVQKTNDTIIIKIDRRKNKDVIIEDIRTKIADALTDPTHMDLLFKIHEEGSEIIIRKRRERY